MTTMLTVGEFARLTHLPVRTLHHYHEVGVLAPVSVDPVTGYRRYAPEQVPDAHLARRLRDVRMPLDEVRAVLAAGPGEERDGLVAAHLDRLQRELATTAAAVTSLRTLLTTGTPPVQLSERDEPATSAVVLRGEVAREDIGTWSAEAYPRLYEALARFGVAPTGPGGALYGPGWFEEGRGRVVAYVPVRGDLGDPAPVDGRVQPGVIPAARLAVALHEGPFDTLDLTYGVLGRHVTQQGIGTDGPIRELYLVSPAEAGDPAALRTEVCWPVAA